MLAHHVRFLETFISSIRVVESKFKLLTHIVVDYMSLIALVSHKACGYFDEYPQYVVFCCCIFFFLLLLFCVCACACACVCVFSLSLSHEHTQATLVCYFVSLFFLLFGLSFQRISSSEYFVIATAVIRCCIEAVKRLPIFQYKS